MYTTCLFCHAALGHNAVIERFPVGRRLAFDPAKGRLWVVCLRCARWNLTPLEERWEAVEGCERRFRATPLRASTDHVGLARLAEGLDLVRVGRALRPEMAVWRYGRHLHGRYVRATGWRTLGALGAGSVIGGIVAGAISPAAAAAVLGLGGPLVYAARWGSLVDRIAPRADAGARPEARPAATAGPYGAYGAYRVRRGDLGAARILLDAEGEGWALLLAHTAGTTRLEGHAAVGTLARLMVHLNRRGASEYVVGRAVGHLATVGAVGGVVASAARAAERLAEHRAAAQPRRTWWSRADAETYEAPGLGDLDPVQRLALEMALHEDSERRALDGELAALETAWREAEEVAAIADDLLLPAAVVDFMRRQQRPRPTPDGAPPRGPGPVRPPRAERPKQSATVVQ